MPLSTIGVVNGLPHLPSAFAFLFVFSSAYMSVWLRGPHMRCPPFSTLCMSTRAYLLLCIVSIRQGLQSKTDQDDVRFLALKMERGWPSLTGISSNVAPSLLFLFVWAEWKEMCQFTISAQWRGGHWVNLFNFLSAKSSQPGLSPIAQILALKLNIYEFPVSPSHFLSGLLKHIQM